MLCSEFVKTATKKLHAEAEAVLVPIIKCINGNEEYQHLLTLFFGFFAPVEALIAQHIHTGILPDFAIRRKSDLLMKSLGEGRCLPVAPELLWPVINNTAQAFGAMYVLEGSTLGGKIISQMLSANSSLQLTKNSLAFFNMYGNDTYYMWSRFKMVMDALFSNEDDMHMVSETACDTFIKMKNWLQSSNI